MGLIGKSGQTGEAYSVIEMDALALMVAYVATYGFYTRAGRPLIVVLAFSKCKKLFQEINNFSLDISNNYAILGRVYNRSEG